MNSIPFPSMLSRFCFALFLALGITTSGLAAASTADKTADDKKSKPKQVKIGDIDWYVDYDAALKIAKEKKKPIWLHFGENPG